MKVLKFDKSEIYKLIETKAKFQKVMVLFDENTSNLEVMEVYNIIKEICIYNQSDINNLDINELNNGYRVIIYFCSAKNFLKLGFDKTEFVNLCIVKGNDILPYCLNYDSTIIAKDLYILTINESFDVNMYSSLCFNKFYNYIFNVVNLRDCNFEMEFSNNNVNNLGLLEDIFHVNKEFLFIDLDIISKTNIEYKHLSLLHLMLINAFLLMLNNVKYKTLELVDVYKVCKDDYVMLDKFYAMANNEVFFTMISLNYNFLINLCLKVKEEILNHFILCDMCESDIQKIFSELKSYAKNTNNIIGYLYLYDFFKV